MNVSGPARVIRRSASDVPVRQLEHRRVQILSAPEDGVGELTVVVARYAPGKAKGHVHWPGGEALYVVAGKGRLRVEGLPLTLEPGIGAFTPTCLEHHVENDLDTEMILVGAFCPGAVPGSYPDLPQRMEPTGKVSSVANMYRRADPAAPVAPGRPTVQPLLEDLNLSPHTSLRLWRLAPGDIMSRQAAPFTRGWLVLSGAGDLLAPHVDGGPLKPWDLVVGSAGVSLGIQSGTDVMTVLEIDAHLNPDRVRTEPC